MDNIGVISGCAGLDFGRVLKIVKAGWGWLAGGIAVGLTVAAVFVGVSPNKYEAIAVFRSGTIGYLSTNDVLNRIEVESVNEVAERLKLISFYNDELLNSCKGATAGTLKDNTKVTLIKGNKLLEIRYVSGSPLLAKTCISALVVKLANLQQKSIDYFVQTSRNRDCTGKDRTSCILSDILTNPAGLLEPVYASESAISPNNKMALMVGLFGGLLFGGLLLIIRQSCRPPIQSNVDSL